MRIGIDFGGVIVRQRKRLPGEDTPLLQPGDESQAHDGAVDGIRELVNYCGGDVWIVSKAGPAMQVVTTAWLESVDFFARTGMRPENVRYCLQRDQKADICTELKISHFIDDKVHVMQILRHHVANLLMFGETITQPRCPPWAVFVSSWGEICKLLTAYRHN